MKRLSLIALVGGLMLAGSSANMLAQDNGGGLVDTRRSDNVLEIQVHALGGLSALTQNYAKSIEQCDYVESAPGASLGVGARIEFPLNNFFTLSTGCDLLWSHNTATLTMVPEQASASTMYNSYSYLYAKMPIVGSFNFSLNKSVKWYVDGGVYFAPGVWGKSNSHIFTTHENQLRQIITSHYHYRRNYFREDDPLIAQHHSLDFGLTLGSGFIVNQRWSLGLELSYGIKNSSKNSATLTTRTHNLWCLATLGYRFNQKKK